MSFDVIVAYAERDRAIGRNGAIPWDRLPADMKFFAQATRGGTVVMGRRTYASLPGGRPLPGRRNIVVSATTTASDYPPGVAVAPSLDDALALAATCPNVWVIGGERLYAEAIAHPGLRRVHATVIKDLRVEHADAFFPAMPAGVFEPVGESACVVHESGVTWTRTAYQRGGAVSRNGDN
jgi:dihydrofolate reductase